MSSSTVDKTSTMLKKLSTGVQVHLDKRGNGDELIVFLHAIGGNSSSWSHQLEYFSKDYTVVSFDMRGHNKSFSKSLNLDNDISIEKFAQDTCALISELGYSKAHLVGLSMGSVVAQEVYSQRPDLVQSLTIANGWCFLEDKDSRISFMEKLLEEGELIESSRKLIPDLFAPGFDRASIDAAIEIEGAKDKTVFLNSWRSMFNVDYRQMIPKISVPILLIGGTEDKVTPTHPLLTDIKESAATAQLLEIDGAGHFSNIDHCKEFNKCLSIHLKRARASASTYLCPEDSKSIELNSEIVAHGLVKLLNQRGIRYFFSNSGTDFTPIIDGFAKFKDDPDFNLEPIVSPHENTAIAMAHGYYLMTGKPQVVMGHVNVGTANMGLGIINANRARIPVVVLSGNTPWYDSEIEGCRTNFVQWGQDTFDQASYFREFTKWDYELKGSHHLETVVDRAIAIAKSDPQGPVYLTLPKEALCEALPQKTCLDRITQNPTSAGGPSPDAVAKAGRLIASSKNPLIVTSELGRYPGGVEALVQLASSYSIPVIEHGKKNFFNFPTESPYHLGFDPSPFVEEADLIIAIECHVPWIPALSGVETAPNMIHIGVDPLCENLPMRAFPSQVNLQGLAPIAIDALNKTLSCLSASQSFGEREFFQKIAKRGDSIGKQHSELFERKRSLAKEQASNSEITKDYLSHCIGDVVDDSVVIFNEYNLCPYQVPRHLPDSWFENSVASGLGWSLGAALGAQLASPDQTMMVTLGDGSYMFNTPLSAHYVAEAYDLPVVIVVFNDNAWSTIKKSYKGSMPSGWGVKNDYMPLCDFKNPVEFHMLAQSVGGVGMKVEKPEELKDKLKEAIEISRTQKSHVLVNVICQRDG